MGMGMAIINITSTIPAVAEDGMAAMAVEEETVRSAVVMAGEGIVAVVEGIVEEENE